MKYSIGNIANGILTATRTYDVRGVVNLGEGGYYFVRGVNV